METLTPNRLALRRSRWAWAAAALLVAMLSSLAVACDDDGTAAKTPTATPTPIEPADLLGQLYGYNKLLAEMALDIPGFGGMYIGTDQETLHVNMTDPSLTRVEDVRASLARVFPEDTRLQSHDIQLHQVEYSFLELAAWYVPLSPLVLAHPDAISTDIDEGDNLIRIVVQNREAADWVRGRIEELSIPDNAVTVELGEPFSLDDSLPD